MLNTVCVCVPLLAPNVILTRNADFQLMKTLPESERQRKERQRDEHVYVYLQFLIEPVSYSAPASGSNRAGIDVCVKGTVAMAGQGCDVS